MQKIIYFKLHEQIIAKTIGDMFFFPDKIVVNTPYLWLGIERELIEDIKEMNDTVWVQVRFDKVLLDNIRLLKRRWL